MAKNPLLTKLLPAAAQSYEDMRTIATEAARTDYDLTIAKEERDKRVAEVTDEYGGAIAALDKRLTKLVGSLRAWALAHRGEYFAKVKSLVVDGHELRFRQGNGALACDAKDTAMVDALLATGDDELIEAGVTVKPALDKVSIKAHLAAGDELGQRLEGMGFRIVKEEEFSFVPGRVAD